jgi:hypothetical protein
MSKDLDNTYEIMDADSKGQLSSFILAKYISKKFKNRPIMQQMMYDGFLPETTTQLVKKITQSNKYDLCDKKRYNVAEKQLNNVMTKHLSRVYHKPTLEICKYISKIANIFKDKFYHHFFTQNENDKFGGKIGKTISNEYQFQCIQNIIISYFRLAGIFFQFNPEIIINAFKSNLSRKKNKLDVVKKYYIFINNCFKKNIINFQECIIEKYDKYREQFLEQKKKNEPKLPKSDKGVVQLAEPTEIKLIKDSTIDSLDDEYNTKFENIPMYYEKCIVHIKLLNKMITNQQKEIENRFKTMKKDPIFIKNDPTTFNIKKTTQFQQQIPPIDFI